ncbi:hypothetical protein DIPPA_14819 [Diplonema papillatum]|nr:hypothetical protein DIPPA_14819 [Diplonema papillatum]
MSVGHVAFRQIWSRGARRGYATHHPAFKRDDAIEWVGLHTRTSHADYPPYMPVDDDEELMDFTDPMMRHERFNRDLRINHPNERLLSDAQREVLEARLNRQLEGKIRAKEIEHRIASLLDERKAGIRSKILVGDEIPEAAAHATITHIGTLDGFEEAVEPVRLTRGKALRYAAELDMALCVTGFSEDGTEAVCRLRHLNAWLTRRARARIALETSQMQVNADREHATVEYSIRAHIEQGHLAEKGILVCDDLHAKRRVRITVRNCVSCRDAAELLLHVCWTVHQMSFAGGGKPAAAFYMGAPMFDLFGASSVLTPLGEGRKTQLIDARTMLELGNAVQQARDEEFEKNVAEAGESQRIAMEESRRRMFYGVQEDFLSSKLRDNTIIASTDPWSLPVTNSDLQTMEITNAMRLAGQSQEQIDEYTAPMDFGEHKLIKPDDLREATMGTASDHDVELSPGPDGSTRIKPFAPNS